MTDSPSPQVARTQAATHAPSFIERGLIRYATWSARHAFAVSGLLLSVGVASALYGAGIHIRQSMEDLFPDHTPAVLEARRARKIMRSSSQMVVIFGSPNRDANRRLAGDFCAKMAGDPEIASLECRRDVDFFRDNAALYLPVAELEQIERDTQERIRAATRADLLGDALTEGLDAAAAKPAAAAATAGHGDAPGLGQADDEDDEEDFGEPSVAPAGRATASAQGAPKVAQKAQKTSHKDGVVPPAAAGAASPSKRLPTDDELRQRLGAKEDLREWSESPDGTVLGIKLFPTVPAHEVDLSTAFVAKVETTMRGLDPKRYHPQMNIAYRGDYAEMSKEVSNIRSGLALTTGLALLGIALIQLLAFRRMRALLLLFAPLLLGVTFTMAFARGAVGYLNLITAFIFGILFGLGNDFGVYTLSRYLEERAEGKTPEEAVVAAVPGLWAALRTAAMTTTAAFLSLTVFEFRGFSQFGLIAGVGVLLALVATMLLFPPLAVALHRLVAEPDVKLERAQGLRFFGWFANPTIARRSIVTLVLLAAIGAMLAPGLHFDTNFRKLRTPSSSKRGGASAASTARRLGNKYRNTAEKRTASPILVITDDIADAHAVHRQLKVAKTTASRLKHFVSIHSFIPENQAEKAKIAERIRTLITAKIDVLKGEDRAESERALKMLNPKPFAAKDLPDFVRKRFLDVDGNLGRYVLIYANGNLSDARSVQEVVDQLGAFHVGAKVYRATASFFILAEADQIIRREGPWAVLLAALAVLLVIGFHYRNARMVVYSFVPLCLAFAIFLGVAATMDLGLNLFSISVLPSIFGIGIDGTVHIVHRAWEVGPDGDLRQVLQRIGGAAWVAAVTTIVGFGALLFQDNPGLQTIGEMAVVGILVVCTLANVMAGALLAVAPVPGVTPAPRP